MPKKRRVVPSVEDLTIFRALHQRVKDNPHLSLRAIAPRIGWSPTAIWQCLKRLEGHYGVALFDRSQGGRYRVNTNGTLLFERTQGFLRDHDLLRHWVPAGQTEVTLGCTRTLLTHVLASPVASFMRDERWAGKVRLRFRENEYPRILEDLRAGRIDFGLGPELPRDSDRRLEIDALERDVDTVLITHLDHRFARDRRARVRLKELASERVYVIGTDVLYGSLPLPDHASGGERVEVATFDSVIAAVRIGIGVGLVPGFYWLLDDLRKRGLLYYARTDSEPLRLGVYLPAEGEDGLSEAAVALLSGIRAHMSTLRLDPGWDPTVPVSAFPSSPRELPFPLRDYRYDYYVGSRAPGFGAPEWQRGLFTWRTRGNNVSGQGHEEWEGGIEEFSIEGRFEKNLLYVVGRRRGETFVATYNTLGRGGTLVGIWMGKDHNDEPISAPAVLSSRELGVADLQDITALGMLRFIHNSERGFSLQVREAAREPKRRRRNRVG